MNLRFLACAASIGAFSYLQPYRPFVVSGQSMSPTFSSGALVLGDAHPRRIARGDVVVFRHGDETMVKRVAYLPGDRIERYRFLSEWYIPQTRISRDSMARHGYLRGDLAVPDGRLFVVGDNLPESVDSRSYGTIACDEVLAVLPGARRPNPWGATGHLTHALVASL